MVPSRSSVNGFAVNGMWVVFEAIRGVRPLAPFGKYFHKSSSLLPDPGWNVWEYSFQYQ
jgi:hypothetical protein